MIKIGRVDVSLERRQLFLEDRPLRVGARAFDILEVLIEAGGRLVSKETLFQHVWPETVVEESNLQVHISALRKLLGEDKDLIKTIPGRGYRLIRSHDAKVCANEAPAHPPRPAEATASSNVPHSCTPLIGREQALADVTAALGRAPLVTLVGTGGIGKTQLGLEAARGQIASFDEVRFVSLSAVERPESTLRAIAEALALDAVHAGASAERLIQAIGARKLLLVLDNCEHVIQEAATICEQLVQANPHLRILATSREPLRTRIEQVYWVAPLEVPGEDLVPDEILKYSAVHMFIARTRARDPHFRADSESVRLIGTICRRLDGVPLALELAAARVTALGIRELVAQLDNRFRVLTGGLRTAPARQQNLKAALDWSSQFLCKRERTVLRRLGVFHGSFQLGEACAIAACEDLSMGEVTDAIAGLVSKSLLMFGPCGSAMRYYLLETTRAYALQLLAEAGESETLERWHERYVRTHSTLEDEAEAPATRYG
ncbi:ATP-binding protein [Paraburkholderia aromaticivorans]|nr:winged helix-turn-helix domain-containing protein [Paraburkholderia aromaticivorans]